MDRRPPLAVPPEILIRKTPDKAVLAMLVILARTDIVAGRANHNAWNTLWPFVQDEMQRSRVGCRIDGLRIN